MEYLAHISEDGRNQTVFEHLKGTAELCETFASEFGAEEQGRLVGLSHDIGKYSKEFQLRLLANGPKVDHSTAGAIECYKQNQLAAAFCVAGHHSGLMDLGSRTDGADCGTFRSRLYKANKEMIPVCEEWKKELSLPQSKNQQHWTGDNLEKDFFTRMLYSCLTDADFLDTETFMQNGNAKREGGEEISALTEKLDNYIKDWFPPKTELNKQRCNILKACLDAGENIEYKPGLYTLTVPTGGGKTVTSLAFSLHHAKTQGMKRIIYVIPYTSIIEQTADTFRQILGKENVLEHHSGVQFDIEDEANSLNHTLAKATENWDMTIIVTTAVQFFESIYSNRASKCRKLHNLANSILIFDEAQMMPIPYLYPCVSSISQLISHYGATAVLCTATQPSLDKIFNKFLPNRETIELCPEESCDLTIFRRVSFRNRGRMSWEMVANEMREMSQCLCIVNTRKSAKLLFDLLGSEDGIYHLSTLMVPAHRRRVLNEIRVRLRENKTCRVVSTSLIEAGVDVDFPAVFREMAGLDSILQAAGRCNREGKRKSEESIVEIFQSEEKDPPLFKQSIDVGRSIIRQFGEDINSRKAIEKYFKKLLYLKGTSEQDKKKIIELIQSGTFPFETIAQKFKLIESNTTTVYIPYGDGEELIERLEHGERSRGLFREIGQYSVSLYEGHFQSLLRSGAIEALNNNTGDSLWILTYKDLYREEDGLSIQGDTGQALFI